MIHQFDLRASLPQMRQFFVDKKLGAQNGKTRCQYIYNDGCRCVIGAGLPDDVAPQLNQTSNVIGNWNELGMDNLPKTELADTRLLQQWHDEVCQPRRYATALKEFTDVFNQILTKYGLEPVS